MPTGDATTRGTVYVQTLDPFGYGSPLLGTRVVFADPDGTIASSAIVDRTGAAQGDILPGGTVTAVFESAPKLYEIESIAGVSVGDHLHLSAVGGDHSNARSVTVTFPAATGASGYYVYGPCGSAGASSTTATIELDHSCDAAPVDVLIASLDSEGLQSGYFEADDLSSDPIQNLSGTWKPFESFTATVDGIPGDVTKVALSRYSDPGHRLSRDFLDVPREPSVTFTTTMGRTVAPTIVETKLGRGDPLTSVLVYERTAGDASDYHIDVAANVLPWVAPPQFDGTTRTITVPVSGGTTTPDLVATHLVFRRTNQDGTVTELEWRVISPWKSSLELPQMPPELLFVEPDTAELTLIRDATLYDWPESTAPATAPHDFDDAVLGSTAPFLGSELVRVSTSANI